MSDLIEGVRSYFKRKKDHLAKKLKLALLFVLSTSLILVGLSIYLGKVIAPLFLFCGVVGLAIWWFRKSQIGEFANLLEYIKSIISNLLKRISGKEKELNKTMSSPAYFTLLQLLTLANEEERQTLERFSGILFDSAENFNTAIRKKSTNDIVSLEHFRAILRHNHQL